MSEKLKELAAEINQLDVLVAEGVNVEENTKKMYELLGSLNFNDLIQVNLYMEENYYK